VIRRNKRIKKGYVLHYGPVEEAIIKHIDSDGQSTMDEIVESSGLNKKDVSRALVDLVIANVLVLKPRDGGDLYMAK
jgi:hypothetical protein